MLANEKDAIAAICMELTQKLLNIPGSVGAAVSIERYDASTHHAKIDVDFTSGRRSQVIAELKLTCYGDLVDVDENQFVVDYLLAYALRAFRDKVTKDEAQLWRATKAEARAAIVEADDAFASVEKTVG